MKVFRFDPITIFMGAQAIWTAKRSAAAPNLPICRAALGFAMSQVNARVFDQRLVVFYLDHSQRRRKAVVNFRISRRRFLAIRKYAYRTCGVRKHLPGRISRLVQNSTKGVLKTPNRLIRTNVTLTVISAFKLIDAINIMNITVLSSGVVGAVVSIAAMYVFYEISVAYWAPDKAGSRWKSLIRLPKLLYFAPTFRWLMPLLAIFMILQLFISMRMVFAGIGIN